jgi:hypothetical protein
VAAHVGTVRDPLSSWESDTAYINFAERDIPGDRLFGPYAHHRLRGVKAAYDPADLFRSNHPVAPAPAVKARRPAGRVVGGGR